VHAHVPRRPISAHIPLHHALALHSFTSFVSDFYSTSHFHSMPLTSAHIYSLLHSFNSFTSSLTHAITNSVTGQPHQHGVGLTALGGQHIRCMQSRLPSSPKLLHFDQRHREGPQLAHSVVNRHTHRCRSCSVGELNNITALRIIHSIVLVFFSQSFHVLFSRVLFFCLLFDSEGVHLKCIQPSSTCPPSLFPPSQPPPLPPP
jgi:hypothetical protein